MTAAAKKNAKKKEKKDAAKADDAPPSGGGAAAAAQAPAQPAKEAVAAPAAEKSGEPTEVEKKIKNLKKKLRQIDELTEKKAAGAELDAGQTAKVASRAETEAEIAKWESLGELDVGKKVKNLKKKLRQIEELEEKKAGGVELNEDQLGKVAGKKELLDEIKAMEALAIS